MGWRVVSRRWAKPVTANLIAPRRSICCKNACHSPANSLREFGRAGISCSNKLINRLKRYSRAYARSASNPLLGLKPASVTLMRRYFGSCRTDRSGSLGNSNCAIGWRRFFRALPSPRSAKRSRTPIRKCCVRGYLLRYTCMPATVTCIPISRSTAMITACFSRPMPRSCESWPWRDRWMASFRASMASGSPSSSF